VTGRMRITTNIRPALQIYNILFFLKFLSIEEKEYNLGAAFGRNQKWNTNFHE
jgi:hypothetical protein